jgi:DNA-binding NtrC family response regulator
MILIVDDDVAVLESIAFLLKQNSYDSCKLDSPENIIQVIQDKQIELVILDMNFKVETTGEDGLRVIKTIKESFPEIPVILITGWGHMSLAIEGMKAGASDFLNKPWDNKHLIDAIQSALKLVNKETHQQIVKREELEKNFNFSKIVGNDPKLLEVLQIVSRVSKTNASVLITGESGTGKELIAEAIHFNSDRSKNAFVKVNLGGLSDTLFESEIFGHKKGAFTDAYHDRKGRFEEADKGTIFLDELGELDLRSQVKLLRVLQERKFEVLGSSKTQNADVRVICATNKVLTEMVKMGTFREDLLYRVNLITLHIPALRDRKEDIPLLANHFLNNLKELYNRNNLEIAKSAYNWLKELPFYGNIRELKNLVERTILISEKETLEIEDFKKHIEDSVKRNVDKSKIPGVGEISLEELEIEMIKKAMKFHSNKIIQVASSLGISRNALYRRLEKYKISYED